MQYPRKKSNQFLNWEYFFWYLKWHTMQKEEEDKV